MKKIISLMLAMTVLLSVFAGLSLHAEAADYLKKWTMTVSEPRETPEVDYTPTESGRYCFWTDDAEMMVRGDVYLDDDTEVEKTICDRFYGNGFAIFCQLTAGVTYHFQLYLDDDNTGSFPVYVGKAPYTSVTYTPVKAKSFTENTYGDYVTDASGNKVYYYFYSMSAENYWAPYAVGDKLTVKNADGTSTVYTCYQNSSGAMNFRDAKGNDIPGGVTYTTDQRIQYTADGAKSVAWKVGTHNITYHFADLSVNVPVTIVAKPSVADAKVTGITAKVYTGKAITQKTIVKYNGTLLTKGTDYTVSYKYNVNAGTAKVIIKGIGNYGGSITKTFTIKKDANPMTATGKVVSLKYSKVKKAKQAIARKKAITVSKAKGTVTYAKASGNSKIVVNKTTGNITVKKGLKKGTYKVKIKVTAAGTTNYKKLTKVVTVTIKVK